MGYEKSFIEVQFPVSKISKESYKERKANVGQTLTGLGKWWGRKPLILVRAILLGILMPVSGDLKRDREIFLKILTMDEDGLYLRKFKNLTTRDIYKYLNKEQRLKYFLDNSIDDKPIYLKKISKDEKDYLQKITFNKLSYDEKLNFCKRPEHISNLLDRQWKEINNYLGTDAKNIQELINELGIKKYGHVPKVGDCFSGGGSIPFEVARIGADTFAADLNPIATLLTWADLNILSKSDDNIVELKKFQEKVYLEVDKQINELGIEINEYGDIADAYLYCCEVVCPECKYKVPLAPSWIIGKGTKTVAILEDNTIDGFNINIIQGADNTYLKKAKENITVRKNNMYCPHCKKETPIIALRNDHKDYYGNTVYGLRKWDKNEFIPSKNDVFNERLYCIRYVNKEINNGKTRITRYYTKPTKEDFKREEKVIKILSEKFREWQEVGIIPSLEIEKGYNTDELIRTRGWKYWHQLFNPRQLLIHALFNIAINKYAKSKYDIVLGILGINKLVNWNAKLSRWNSDGANEKGQEVFSNQALNPLFNYISRTMISLKSTWFFNINNNLMNIKAKVETKDARAVKEICDIWITDPPYADAINYHELTEFFLAWDKVLLEKAFPNWYADSKRVLAVKGTGITFNDSMIEIYKNLSSNMTEEGTQVIMFTHQDVKVWAELAMILWTCGLQVTAAWNIATETDSGGRQDGNYVQGTVILVLRKQHSNQVAYLDELYPEIEDEVKIQIDSMKSLDDKEDPNFSDTDYLLAAYAASLKVLTSYKTIEDIDIKYELSKNRNNKEETPIQKIINEAKKIAYDYLIPVDFDNYLWKELKPVERFYLKGLEFEMNNMCKLSGYQELAKGFGVNEYNWMLGSTKANSARVKTPKEFAMKNINDNSVFGQSLLRHALASIYIGLKEDESNKGLNWLKSEVNDYWNNRNMIVEILNYLSKVEVIDSMEHWKECAHEAFILKNLVENDSI